MSDLSLESAIDQTLARLCSPELVSGTLKLADSNDRITLRPVELKGVRNIQVSCFDGRKTLVKNCVPNTFQQQFPDLLGSSLKSVFLTLAGEEFHLQVSRKGKPQIVVKKRDGLRVASLQHNRQIDRPLPEGQPDPFLEKIGLMTADGRIKADKHRKYLQINEFIRLVCDSAQFEAKSDRPLRMVDFGCGSAYLTFGLHHYITHKLGIPTEMVGVDHSEDRVRHDSKIAQELGAEDVRFVASTISDYSPPETPDIVVALHACDTATDAALAQAISHRAEFVFVAPCCHHHLQVQLASAPPSIAHQALMQDAILRERLGDILTDEFRALILRIAGYKVDVIEFAALEHTARNLLIRAKRVAGVPTESHLEAYKALKDSFGVTPYLESLVPDYIRFSMSP